MSILFIEELNEDRIEEVSRQLMSQGVVIAKSVDPSAVILALEYILSRHEGESSGMEIEKLSEGGPFLIHPGGVKLKRRRREGSIEIHGVGSC